MTTRIEGTPGVVAGAAGFARSGFARSGRAVGGVRDEAVRDEAVRAAYERQEDGLFTYCLSVLCEHDAAAEALGEVRELARRHAGRLAEAGLVRAWLFAVARYCCLRRLAGCPGSPGSPGGTGVRSEASEVSEVEAARRRRELASLAWPEAAGTDPEQREALELSVRHRLTPLEVAAVLGLPFERTRALLGGAEAEVARTRAALLVLGVGSCPELDRLGGAGAESWRDWVLGPALRRELVQHVVDCPTCRGTAERVAADEAGAEGVSGLPLLGAPVAASAASAASAAGVLPVEPGLRFDHGGFPRHRAPDTGRGRAVRRRMVTTGVLAAVLAAPVVALWAGHRSGGGAGSAASVSAVRVDEEGRRPAGSAVTGAAGASVGVAAAEMPGLELTGVVGGGAETLLPGFPRLGLQGPLVPVPGRGATPIGNPTLVAAPARAEPPAPGAGDATGGLLTVEAGEYGSRTVLTLTNSGATEIRWRAVTEAGWLRLSRDSGTLAPGQRITVIVTVDEDLAPAGHWTARIALPPSQAVVTLEGGPHNRGGDGGASSPASPTATASPSSPSPTATATARPSGTATASPTHSPSATPSGTASATAHPPSPSASPSGTTTP
ncbi:sigma-70 family RNA polymerase sigma factor [Kitasatospora sp. NPDC101183]|uniref:BACON domain-containing protein n=1 Tax=Kitasatospora sp. NPDC101183 TaxID=3364100 RepID=UPI00381071F6